MGTTNMIDRCHKLINDIDTKLEPFINVYMNYSAGNLSYDEMQKEMREIVKDMNYQTMREYNEMCKMYSRTNCWWVSFRTGEEVHKLLIEKWDIDREIKNV